MFSPKEVIFLGLCALALAGCGVAQTASRPIYSPALYDSSALYKEYILLNANLIQHIEDMQDLNDLTAEVIGDLRLISLHPDFATLEQMTMEIDAAAFAGTTQIQKELGDRWNEFSLDEQAILLVAELKGALSEDEWNLLMKWVEVDPVFGDRELAIIAKQMGAQNAELFDRTARLDANVSAAILSGLRDGDFERFSSLRLTIGAQWTIINSINTSATGLVSELEELPMLRLPGDE
jgi:hypothetical protein